VLATLPAASVHCCVTSPPYFGLRDYGHSGQIGLEPTPAEYVEQMVAVFREVRRVLRDDGTLWLNLGDSYVSNAGSGHGYADGRANRSERKNVSGLANLKPKDLIGIPWRVAFALQADGWYLRQDIIWSKPNPMPESVQDRCTKAHEYVFLLSKSARYHCDMAAIAEDAATAGDTRPGRGGNYMAGGITGGEREEMAGGQTARGRLNQYSDGQTRNKRSVWTIATQPFAEAHFATMAPELAETCIKAGCPLGGTVLDPFGGAGTTGLVADRLQRDAVLIELNPTYAAMAGARIQGDAPLFAEVA
jgi:DNA modification methylase